MHLQVSLGFAASLIASASAHATWQSIWVNSVDGGSSCLRMAASNNPVTDVTSTDLACNIAGTSTGLCPANAGDTITIQMAQQPGDTKCSDEAIGGDHYGPINVYLAAVSDATTAVGSSANWFKIAEMGLVSNNPDYWATEVLNDNCGHFTFTIPTDIAPGNYLLRAEVIALHVASSVGGAQFYPECFQLNIAGTGTATPPTVKFPGEYSATDPGILINIYQSLTTYAIPGPTPYGTAVPTIAATAFPTTATWNTASEPTAFPTVWPGSAGGSAPTSVKTTVTPTTTAPTTVKTTVTPTTTVKTTTAVPTTTSTAGAAALYGQCGGIGWTGPTTCAQGTCQATNSYYSQCLS
ncbi:carbohydrate-binding module family 1 protein [Hypholoma sublateritium FD-334 SS-4]|uniref:AA9 family lytic polysaccharide monooxygenase n=1 Tax=Hypholoma sublateritium (strain FD-334 SS-4) TaxID=945553 RepID=A0A0D2Q5Q6_HYPSF|nr:carbohydrate-binding module family 1 protein [Hypholoma sublateritium FD-334 SS-4]